MSRCLVVGSVAAFAVLSASFAFAGDDLRDFQARQAVLVQKVTLEAKAALAEAQRLEKTDPARARQLLQRSISAVEDVTGLAESERSNLLTLLRGRVRSLDVVQNEQKQATKEATRRELDKVDPDRPATQGAPAPAPNPGDQAKTMIDRGNAAVNASKIIRDKFEKGSNNVAMEVLKTASDVDPQRITPEFLKTAERGKQQLTKAEVEVLKVLNSTLSVDFDGKITFKEAIEVLQEKAAKQNLNLNIWFDEPSLKDASVEYTDPVTFKAKNITVRTVLKKILGDRGLTYVIKEGAVQVMSPAKAKDMHVTRVYSLDGLIVPGNPAFGPLANAFQTRQQVAGLIQTIIDTVEPASWIPNGGTGSIQYYEPARALIIRNTAEMHYQMAGRYSR